MNCRGCGAELTDTFIDLGSSPIANNLIEFDQLKTKELSYPLHAMTCFVCALVQLSENLPRDILFPPNYTYFSSISTTWLNHSQKFADQQIKYLNLNSSDLVIEVASNDGYLLQFFKNRGMETLGVEPALSVANSAITKGIPTLVAFFGEATALELSNFKKPKLLIGNNVLAHVPDLHDFIKGFSILIDDEGIMTFEFPHLLNLIRNSQFDTIYHEHYTYLSITALLPVFNMYGLKIINIEKLVTHGGSLRVFAAKQKSKWVIQNSVERTIYEEREFDPRNKTVSESFRNRAQKIKKDLFDELLRCKIKGRVVSAYGAAAKGVTLLNYCNVGAELIEYVVDLNPSKLGKYLPGSHIPIVSLDTMIKNPPNIVLALPWNLSVEIKSQLSAHLGANTKIIRAVPKLESI